MELCKIILILATLGILGVIGGCGQVPEPEGPPPSCEATTAEVFSYFNSVGYMTVEEATELTRLHAENCRNEQSTF